MINLKLLPKVFRIHHWIKNFLLFIPLITAHKFYNLDLISIVFVAFISFSLCASAIYIINDILDIKNDQAHPNKKNRPFASGKISIKSGIILCFILLILSFIFALKLSGFFIFFLIFYFLLSATYSLFLKKIKYLDCLVLVTFYIIRIFSGGAVINISPSVWLIIFSIFIFISLAFAKRYIELNSHYGADKNSKAIGRAYTNKDIKNLYFLGTNSGYVSVLILTVYLNSETVSKLYQSPIFIWLTVPLLFIWVKIFWKKSKNKEIHDDPLIFSIKDKWSIMIILLFFLLFFLGQFI